MKKRVVKEFRGGSGDFFKIFLKGWGFWDPFDIFWKKEVHNASARCLFEVLSMPIYGTTQLPAETVYPKRNELNLHANLVKGTTRNSDLVLKKLFQVPRKINLPS